MALRGSRCFGEVWWLGETGAQRLAGMGVVEVSQIKGNRSGRAVSRLSLKVRAERGPCCPPSDRLDTWALPGAVSRETRRSVWPVHAPKSLLGGPVPEETVPPDAACQSDTLRCSNGHELMSVMTGAGWLSTRPRTTNRDGNPVRAAPWLPTLDIASG